MQSFLAGSALLFGGAVTKAAKSAAAPDTANSHRLRINGAQIHYREWGKKNSPPLLLLHPAPLNSHVWLTLGPALATRFRVIAPDARGFGDSDWAAEYSNDMFLDDLQKLLVALDVHRPVLCGNSFGATLAFMYAGLHSTEVDRLILIDTGPGLKPGAAPPAGARPAGPIPTPPGPFDTPEAAQSAAAAPLPPFMAAAFAREMREGNLRRTADGKWDWKFDRQGTAAGAARAATDPRKWPAWEAVACPTLVLRGERSPAFPAEAAEQMVAGRKNVELRVIPGAGHFIPLDAPQALELEIRKWLQME